MFCENCGAKLPDNAGYCPVCRTPIGGGRPAAGASPAYLQAQQQQRFYNQMPAYNPALALREPLGVGSFLGMLILSSLPLVGFILLLVWAFGGSVNQNKQNLARAYLLLSLITLAIGVIVTILSFAFGVSLLDSLNSYF